MLKRATGDFEDRIEKVLRKIVKTELERDMCVCAHSLTHSAKNRLNLTQLRYGTIWIKTMDPKHANPSTK